MKTLAPGKVLIENGIEYRKLKNGDGRFRVLTQLPGYPRVTEIIGRESEGVTRKTCEDFISKLHSDAREGRLNLNQGKPFKTHLFSTFADDYLKQMEKLGGRGIKDKGIRLRLHLIPFFGNTPLTRITSLMVEEYKAQRIAQNSERGGDWRSKNHKRVSTRRGVSTKPVSKGTINKELGVLSHVLNMAVEWGIIDRKPCKIVKYREDNHRIEYLTEEQMHTLLETAKRDHHPVIYLFMLMGLSTGMRKMEILRTRVEDIDFGQKEIHVPVAKAGARIQPFPENMVLELQRYMKKTGIKKGWLFPSKISKSGHRMNVEKPFARVVEAAGLDSKRIVRHTLRHTCITHLVQQGVDLPSVAVISGHKTLQMVQRYAHQNNDHIQSALRKLSERLPTPTPPIERLRLTRKVALI